MNSIERLQTRCAVVGGGPAGMMLGFLLARSGVQVTVLEKHDDFLRDFRGDTIHPSTLELMHELGLLEEFLAQPHQEVSELCADINGHTVPVADFTRLPTRCKFIAFMPQWDFLKFLSEHATRFPCFTLGMGSEVDGLLFRDDRVIGVSVKTPSGRLEVHADLVVGADGRSSTVRRRANLPIQEFGVPIDVLWMRISKWENDPKQSLGFFRRGRFFVMLDRGDYWQCGFIIPKGTLDQLKARGLPSFHKDLVEAANFLRNRAGELDDWSKIKLLTVQINRLRQWSREGLLCIGDAAHAMSPAGGVGINLAIQDAVATANLLAEKLRKGGVSLHDLSQVQHRREWPTRLIQRIQVAIHSRITGQTSSRQSGLPIFLRLLRAFPILRQIPARFIGIGPRPEHIRTAAAT